MLCSLFPYLPLYTIPARSVISRKLSVHIFSLGVPPEELHSLFVRLLSRKAARLLSWTSHRSHPQNPLLLRRILEFWISCVFFCLLYFFGYIFQLPHQVKSMAALYVCEQVLAWDLPSPPFWRTIFLLSGWFSSFLYCMFSFFLLHSLVSLSSTISRGSSYGGYIFWDLACLEMTLII